MPSTAARVNLQQIPFAAIERVEVLRDGASAIYGTDAIAGVINFITRKDYSGLQVYGAAYLPQEKGGEQYQANILAGWGDLAKDRFNIFGVLSYTDQNRLKAADRDFSKTGRAPRYLDGPERHRLPVRPADAARMVFPANIVTSPTQTPAGAFRNPYASPFAGATPGVETNPYIGVFPERRLPAARLVRPDVERDALPLRLHESGRHPAGQRSVVVPGPRDVPAESRTTSCLPKSPGRTQKSTFRGAPTVVSEATTKLPPNGGNRAAAVVPGWWPVLPGQRHRSSDPGREPEQ